MGESTSNNNSTPPNPKQPLHIAAITALGSVAVAVLALIGVIVNSKNMATAQVEAAEKALQAASLTTQRPPSGSSSLGNYLPPSQEEQRLDRASAADIAAIPGSMPAAATELSPIPVSPQPQAQPKPVRPKAQAPGTFKVKVCDRTLQQQTFHQQPDQRIASGNVPSLRADVPKGILVERVGVHHGADGRVSHFEVKLQNLSKRTVYIARVSLQENQTTGLMTEVCAELIKFPPGRWVRILISYRVPSSGDHGRIGVAMGITHV